MDYLIELKYKLRLASDARCIADRQDEEERFKRIRDGAATVTHLSEVASEIGVRSTDFASVTHPEAILGVLRWSSGDLSLRVQRALSLQMRGAPARLARALLDTWARLHQTIDFTNIPIFDEVGKGTPTYCAEAGMCLCGARGKVMKSFQTKLEKPMKHQCPAKSTLRGKLVSADLVLLLIGQSKPEEVDRELAWADSLVPGPQFKQ